MTWQKVTKDTPGQPPLGVMPERIWLEHRVSELCRAIHAYNPVPRMKGLADDPVREWALELSRHLDTMQGRGWL